MNATALTAFGEGRSYRASAIDRHGESVLKWAAMKKNIISALAVFVVGSIFVGAVHAYPQPGPNQETYVTYYSDAAHTRVIGVRAIAHDSACAPYHITWGSTSSYSTVTVERCSGTGGEV
jgi:hypothetical protein